MSKLTATNGSVGDEFGRSVAVSGSIIVVGAYLYDDNGTDSGAAYIFNTARQFLIKLAAQDGGSDDNFGLSMAVDGSTIVVGSHLDDDNGTNSG